MDLEDFKKEYKEELDYALLQVLLNAITGELQREMNNYERFIKKIAFVTEKVNTEYYERIPYIFETFKEKGIEAALSEIEDIGLYFDSPDLRGLHRKKSLPSPNELYQEYYDLHVTLKERLQRRYRNPEAEKLAIVNILNKVIQISNGSLNKEIEKWVKKRLPKSEIALKAIAHKYSVSSSTIKKALAKKEISQILGPVNK